MSSMPCVFPSATDVSFPPLDLSEEPDNGLGDMFVPLNIRKVFIAFFIFPTLNCLF